MMLDVLIVGAGISGLSAACHLRRHCPNKSFTVLEARDDIGGTWDLFRYPGIRSDSDMHTFGFNFKPWTQAKTLADGPAILNYLHETVDEYQLSKHLQFSRRVTSAAWNSAESQWTVTAINANGETEQHHCRLLFMGSGYYDYKAGYTPDIPGLQDFKGQLVHPQLWPTDLDYSRKRVVVIGSGATAVTLVPAMAEQAAHITMLQRSPTYIVSWPSIDWLAKLLNKWLPAPLAYRIVRWRNIRMQNFVYQRSRKKPEKVKAAIVKLLRKQLGDDFDIDTHFTPSYNPWDQRLCLVPDGDLFTAIKSGKVEVVTDQIAQVTESGVTLHSGKIIDADILVTATGLQLQLLGGVEFTLDGHAIDFSQRFFYQGMMFSGVPNLILTFGYINASWTLRADLNAAFLCALLKRMDAKSATRCVPELRPDEKDMPAQGWVSEFTPGYMQRSLHLFPRQGDHAPWHNTQNYFLDRKLLGNGPVDDGVLQFS